MATHSSILVWIASCWPWLESSGAGRSSPGGPLHRPYECHVTATRASNERESTSKMEATDFYSLVSKARHHHLYSGLSVRATL